jgi:hypothetical protein
MLFFVAGVASHGSSPAAKALEVIINQIESAIPGAPTEQMTQQVIIS